MSKAISIMGYLFIFYAAYLLGLDTLAAFATTGITIWTHPYMDAGTLWFLTHSESLQQIQAIIQRYIHPAIWDPGIQWILLQPAFGVIGAIGTIILILTGTPRKKNPKRNYKFR